MSHYYDSPCGKYKYPSVTTIISDATDKSGALCQWAANQCVEWLKKEIWQQDIGIYSVTDEHLEKARFAYKETSQTALDVGSEVHNAIEVYLKREIARGVDGEGHFDITDPVYATLSKQAMHSFNAFNAWYKEYNVKPIALEQTVYGDCWAGTLDFLGYFNDKLYVIDWKSSKAHYPEMRYQVAAYRGAVNSSDSVMGCGVLRLDKETGLPDWKDTSKTYERDLQIFDAMKRLYFLRHLRIAKNAGWHTPF